MLTEFQIIQACRQGDRRAQQVLYDRYAPAMFAVCKRYLRRPEDAEDVLLEAFFKIFTNLEQFKFEGSFPGWLRRIVVNEALMFLRRKHNFNELQGLDTLEVSLNSSVLQELVAQDILNLLELIPVGCRTVFNLYVLEGYRHREIAQMLQISINTSKSQLIAAKKKLRYLLEQCQYPGLDALAWSDDGHDDNNHLDAEQKIPRA